jgi:hypothetical protein
LIEPRIYRAAFLPAVLAVVLVMFSLESRPGPLAQGLPADVVFGGSGGSVTAGRVVEGARDRRSGSVGDRRTAQLVAGAFRRQGFIVQVDRFRSHDRDLVNVVGQRAGKSRRQVVVVADRDATGVPDAAGSASDTAALMELARVFGGRPSNKTLVLASVDGGAQGELGAARLASRVGEPGLVDGVVVVSALGYGGRERPAVVGWSEDTARASLRLQRTAAESLRAETNGIAPGPSAAGQVARLSFPLGLGAQGVLLDRGYDAVRIAGGGELADTAHSRVEDIDSNRLGAGGRAVLRTVTAIDQARDGGDGPSTYVTAVSQLMPGWVLAVLGLTLILPPLVASVDAFARLRRRRGPVIPWLAWLGAGVLAFVLGLALAYGLAVVGAIDPPDAPVAPALSRLGPGPAAVLAVVGLTVAGAWVGLRRLVVSADPDLRRPAAPGAAVVLALALSACTLVLWLANPFAALVMVPALHLWTLAVLVDPGPGRRGRLALIAGGLVLPLLLALYELILLSVDPISGAWYLTLLVTGGHLSLLAGLLGCVYAATLAGVISVALSAPPEPKRPPREVPTVRGPASYAGPGSLGGTDSALRR